MTYVELIVVLGIFAVMLSISMFNYKRFQGKVDIKNLANDIALKLVEAQKSAVSGKLVPGATFNTKPSYGVYFNRATSSTKFLYFADLNNSGGCDVSGVACTTSSSVGGEVLDIINITKGNSISSLQVNGCGAPITINGSISVVYKRPSSTPLPIVTNPASGCATITYYAINITSNAATQAVTSQIRLYQSGRMQIN